MTARFRRVVVFVGTAAIAAGTGVGVAASNDDSSSSRSAPGISRPQGPGGGGPGAVDVSPFADELGLSADQSAPPSSGDSSLS
jgi:hypothetical protein